MKTSNPLCSERRQMASAASTGRCGNATETLRNPFGAFLRHCWTIALLFCFGLTLDAQTLAPTDETLYVAETARGTGDGSSWENAAVGTRLQEALNAAKIVKVEAGEYSSNGTGSSDGNTVFNIAAGKTLEGGYSPDGLGAWDPDQYVTVLKPTDGTVRRVVLLNNADKNTTATIRGCTITGGNGKSGAGIHGGSSSTNAAIGFAVIDRCVIKGNTGGGAGAGIWASGATITNCTIENNNGGGNNGGGIFVAGVSEIRGCRIVGNQLGTGGSGAGIFVNNAAVVAGTTITDCSFSGNVTTSMSGGTGGGALCANHAQATTVTNCLFTDNTAYCLGGAILCGSKTIIDSCLIDDNHLNEFGTTLGGGIYSNGATIKNSTITNNTAFANGGGIYVGVSSTITNCRIIGNAALNGDGNNGGGIYVAGVSEIRSCRIIGNTALNGGGIWNNVAGTVVDGCKIAMNKATGANGGGIRTNNVAITIRNSYICSNRCSVNGGGIGGDAFTLENCVVANNWSDGYGAAFWNPNSSNLPIVINCTVVNNDCQNRGNDIAGGHGPSRLQNTIFWDHRGGVCTNGNWLKNNATTINCASNFRIATNMASAVSYIELPTANEAGIKFVSPSTMPLGSEEDTIDPDWESRDWRLRPTSACIAKGTTGNSAPTTDLNGVDRPNPPCIGALEFGYPSLAGRIYVTPTGGAVEQDGLSWATAYPGTRLQEALSVALPIEVWASAGTYRYVDQVSPPHEHFTLFGGIRFYGGFAGTETSLEERAMVQGGKPWEFVNETILLQTLSSATNNRTLYMNNNTLLNGVTITGGSAQQNEPGAGINMAGSNAVVEYCIIKGNHFRAQGSNGTNKSRGGGIYCDRGTVRYSLITENTAIEAGWEGGYGGGIHTAGSATIEYCEISGNKVGKTANNNVSGAQGAGIFANGAGTVIRHCEIYGNSCGKAFNGNEGAMNQLGGGIFINASATIENCYIHDNMTSTSGTSNRAYGLGGGIYVNAAGSTIRECLISRNHAAVNGAGVYVAAALAADDCILEENVASGNGGGLYVAAALTTDSCTIVGNVATQNGGGFYVAAALAADSCILEENMASGNGGGLYVAAGATLYRMQIVKNRSVHGGGIYTTAQLTATACRIGGNIITGTAGDASNQYSGGGIQITGGTNSVITNCVIDNNTGVGISTNTTGTVIQNCTIVKNKNNTGVAEGGVSTIGATGILMRNSIVWGNEKKTVPNSTEANPPLGQIGGNAATNWNNNINGFDATASTNNAFSYSGNGEHFDDAVVATNVYLWPGTVGQSGDNNSFGTISSIPQPFIRPALTAGASGFDPDVDWRLLPGSACNSAGTPTDAPDSDITGKLRSATPSIGAYEYDDDVPYLAFYNLRQMSGSVTAVTAVPESLTVAITYHETEADAIANLNNLTLSGVQEAGVYWVRGETEGGDGHPAMVAYAQLVVLSPFPCMTLEGSGKRSGSNWDNAMGFSQLQEQLNTAGIVGVRLAAGIYMTTGGYTVPAGKQLIGGYDPATGNVIGRSRFLVTGGSFLQMTLAAGTSESPTTVKNLSVENGYRGFQLNGQTLVENCRVYNNRMTAATAPWGTAFHLENADNRVVNSVIEKCYDMNEARGCINYGSTASAGTFVNCIFAHNQGASNNTGPFGGTFINCTFVGNTCAVNAFSTAPATTLKNCVFWNNNNDLGVAAEGSLTVENTAFSQNETYRSNGNFAIDASNTTYFAKVVNTERANAGYHAANDWRLSPNSILINRGSNAAVTANGIATDFSGNPRIYNSENGGLADIGAYESTYRGIVPVDIVVTPAVPDEGAVYAYATTYDVVYTSTDPVVALTSDIAEITYINMAGEGPSVKSQIKDAGAYTFTTTHPAWRTVPDSLAISIAPSQIVLSGEITATRLTIMEDSVVTFTVPAVPVDAPPICVTVSGTSIVDSPVSTTFVFDPPALGDYGVTFTQESTNNYLATTYLPVSFAVVCTDQLIPILSSTYSFPKRDAGATLSSFTFEGLPVYEDEGETQVLPGRWTWDVADSGSVIVTENNKVFAAIFTPDAPEYAPLSIIFDLQSSLNSYTVAFIGDGGSADGTMEPLEGTGPNGTFYTGNTVTLTRGTAVEGKFFDKWTVTGEGASFTGADNGLTIVVTVGGADVVVEAVGESIGNTRYVSLEGNGDQNGCSWRHAAVGVDKIREFNQTATVDTIYVAEGVYALSAAISLVANKALVGGYDLSGERPRIDRNGDGVASPWEFEHETIFDGGGSIRVFNLATGARIDGVTARNGKINYGAGAALNSSNGTAYIDNCTFHGNISTADATYQGGGAVWVNDAEGAKGEIRNSYFYDNTALRGGAICADGGKNRTQGMIVENCMIVNNRASRFGGGIYANIYGTNTTFRISNCVIANNEAPAGGAIAFHRNYTGTVSHIVENSTIVNNRTTTVGYGALHCEVHSSGIAYDVTFTNNIVWNNRTEDRIVNFTAVTANATRFVLNSNAVQGPVRQAKQNVNTLVLGDDEDPFVGSIAAVGNAEQSVIEGANWRLKPTASPVNLGVATSLTTDLDGNPRIFVPDGLDEGYTDLGAYEGESIKGVPNILVERAYIRHGEAVPAPVIFPAELPYTVTYDGSAAVPADVGTYQVSVTVPESDLFEARTATGLLVIYDDVFYLSENGTGGGLSWADAAGGKELETIAALPGVATIHLGGGTYRIGATIHTTNDRAFIGGYNPATGTRPLTDRNGDGVRSPWEFAYETIIDAGETAYGTPSGFNAFTNNANLTLRYDGLTVANARISYANGAAIRVTGTRSSAAAAQSVTIANCTFRDNISNYLRTTDELSQKEYGGVVSFEGAHSKGVVRNCHFYNNQAYYGSALLFDNTGSSSADFSVESCVFQNNKALRGGTLMLGQYSQDYLVRVTNSLFTNNDAPKGSAILLSSNRAANAGASVTITNCTFAANNTTASTGNFGGNPSAVEFTAGMSSSSVSVDVFGAPLTMANCLFWSNSNTIGFGADISNQSALSGAVTLNRCAMQGGFFNRGEPSVTALSINPFTATVPQGWQSDVNAVLQTSYRLNNVSVAFNGGDNTAVAAIEFDLDGNPRIYDNVVDAGVYEAQIQAPQTLFASPSGRSDGSTWERAGELGFLLDAAPQGSVIYLAPGEYNNSDGYVVRKGVSLIGGFDVGEADFVLLNREIDPARPWHYRHRAEITTGARNEGVALTVPAGVSNVAIDGVLFRGSRIGLELQSGATVRNSIFAGNGTSGVNGHGVYINSPVEPVYFENCLIVGNHTRTNNEARGAGVRCVLPDDVNTIAGFVTFSSCTFAGNTSDDYSRTVIGVNTTAASLILVNSVVRGSGTYSLDGPMTLYNCGVSADKRNTVVQDASCVNIGNSIFQNPGAEGTFSLDDNYRLLSSSLAYTVALNGTRIVPPNADILGIRGMDGLLNNVGAYQSYPLNLVFTPATFEITAPGTYELHADYADAASRLNKLVPLDLAVSAEAAPYFSFPSNQMLTENGITATFTVTEMPILEVVTPLSSVAATAATTPVQVTLRGPTVPELVDGFYLIYTPEHWTWFYERLKTATTQNTKAKLMNDITIPISQIGNNIFSGVLTGEHLNNVPKWTITVTGSTTTEYAYMGLFGQLNGGTVEYIRVRYEGNLTATHAIGGIAGRVSAATPNASYCHVQICGNFSVTGNNDQGGGGIFGYTAAAANVLGCKVELLPGATALSVRQSGGFVGRLQAGTLKIESSHLYVHETARLGATANNQRCGGILGFQQTNIGMNFINNVIQMEGSLQNDAGTPHPFVGSLNGVGSQPTRHFYVVQTPTPSSQTRPDMTNNNNYNVQLGKGTFAAGAEVFRLSATTSANVADVTVTVVEGAEYFDYTHPAMTLKSDLEPGRYIGKVTLQHSGAAVLGPFTIDVTVLGDDDGIRYVTSNGTTSRDGRSWETAAPFSTLQTLIDDAAVDTIYIAAGDYSVSSGWTVTRSIAIIGGIDPETRAVVGHSNLTATTATRFFALNAAGLTFTAHNLSMTGTGNYGGTDNTGGVGLAFLASATARVENCDFINHRSSAGGGAVTIVAAVDAIFRDCRFVRAHGNYGGVILGRPSAAGDFVFERCEFRGNTATNSNPTIFHMRGNLRLDNCLVANNGNGFIYTNNATDTVVVNNCTIADNNAFTAFIYGASTQKDSNGIHNSLIYSNGNQTANANVPFDTVTSAYIASGADPKFVDPKTTLGPSSSVEELLTGDYRLSRGSPAIGAGNNSAVVTDTDFDGNPRIRHEVVDLGAFESDYKVMPLLVADNATVAYDGTAKTIAFTITPSALADDVAMTPLSETAVGSYEFLFDYPGSDTYEAVSNTAILTIERAVITQINFNVSANHIFNKEDDGNSIEISSLTVLPAQTVAQSILYYNADGTGESAVFPSDVGNYYARAVLDPASYQVTCSDTIAFTVVSTANPTLSFSTPSTTLTEGNAFTVTVSLVNPATEAFDVVFALDADNFTAASNIVSFDVGDQSKTLDITTKVRGETRDASIHIAVSPTVVVYTNPVLSLTINAGDPPNVRYVTLTGSGSKSGWNWENAAEGISGLTTALSSVNTVYVGAGVYPLTARIILAPSKAVYGGYDPATGLRPTADLNGDNIVSPWEFVHPSIFDGGGNTVAFRLDNEARIDGVTIRNCRGTQGPAVYVYADNGTAYVANCTIHDNNNTQNSQPYHGGAIWQEDRGSRKGKLDLRGTFFYNNTAARNGGAVCFDDGEGNTQRATIENCWFINNKATWGGAIFANTYGTTPMRIANCLIANNEAVRGGAVAFHRRYTKSNSRLLENCTIVNNLTTGSGYGALHAEIYSSNQGAYVNEINNSLLWNNRTNGELLNFSRATTLATFTLQNNVIQGPGLAEEFGTETNTFTLSDNEDPFVASFAPVGNVADTSFMNADWRLARMSNAINRGANNLALNSVDLDGNPRIHDADIGGLVDAGAYESSYKGHALLTATPQTFKFDGKPHASDFTVEPASLADSVTIAALQTRAGDYIQLVTLDDDLFEAEPIPVKLVIEKAEIDNILFTCSDNAEFYTGISNDIGVVLVVDPVHEVDSEIRYYTIADSTFVGTSFPTEPGAYAAFYYVDENNYEVHSDNRWVRFTLSVPESEVLQLTASPLFVTEGGTVEVTVTRPSAANSLTVQLGFSEFDFSGNASLTFAAGELTASTILTVETAKLTRLAQIEVLPIENYTLPSPVTISISETPTTSDVRYVSVTGSGYRTGWNWANAAEGYAALKGFAEDADAATVYVAGGTYARDESIAPTLGTRIVGSYDPATGTRPQAVDSAAWDFTAQTVILGENSSSVFAVANNFALDGFKFFNSTGWGSEWNGGGDAFSITGTADVAIDNCIFYQCGGANGGSNGGAILSTSSGSITVRNSLFDKCLAKGEGGAIRVTNSSVTLEGSSFVDCYAMSGGGAIYLHGAVANSVTDCLFLRCRSNTGDSRKPFTGILHVAGYTEGSLTTIERCRFLSCKTRQGGGGLWARGLAIWSDGETSVGNSLFAYNDIDLASSISGNHGVVSFAASNSIAIRRVYNCTFVCNRNYNSLIHDAKEINNCVVWNNFQTSGVVAPNYSASPNIDDPTCANNAGPAWDRVVFANTVAYNDPAGPGFVSVSNTTAGYAADPSGNDFRLAAGSLLINRGDESKYPSALASAKDLDGNARVYGLDNGGVLDIGAYESKEKGKVLYTVNGSPIIYLDGALPTVARTGDPLPEAAASISFQQGGTDIQNPQSTVGVYDVVVTFADASAEFLNHWYPYVTPAFPTLTVGGIEPVGTTLYVNGTGGGAGTSSSPCLVDRAIDHVASAPQDEVWTIYLIEDETHPYLTTDLAFSRTIKVFGVKSDLSTPADPHLVKVHDVTVNAKGAVKSEFANLWATGTTDVTYAVLREVIVTGTSARVDDASEIRNATFINDALTVTGDDNIAEGSIFWNPSDAVYVITGTLESTYCAGNMDAFGTTPGDTDNANNLRLDNSNADFLGPRFAPTSGGTAVSTPTLYYPAKGSILINRGPPPPP